MPLLEARGITKIYTDMAEPVQVLRGIDLILGEGEVVGIYGASGSGKSTLLHILGGLDSPDDGKIHVKGVDIGGLKNDELASFRNRTVGFVFQFYHLLPEFSALENVMLPVLISGKGKGDARDSAASALEAMGLSERMDHRPAMLSGGEQQRVAIARAAVMHPPIILADEPTGNLDSRSGEIVWKYLLELNRREGMTIAVATHNRDLVTSLDMVYELADGILHRSGSKGL